MHVGMWGLAVIVIVVASWLMYRYLAPGNWKDRPLLPGGHRRDAP